MRIVIFSVGPVFPDHVHGGSQKILADVATHLGAVGHDVSLFCTSRDDNSAPFTLGRNARVLPTLGFRPTYPEPYYAPPFRLASIIDQLRSALEHADVFYIHDGELLFHFLYDDVPTVVSFRDFVYPDTLAGAFSFRRDALILNSEYVAGCVVDAFSSFRPGVGAKMTVIRNGIDLTEFRPGRAPEIRDFAPVPRDAITLLYPHRPDPRKGVFDCLEVLARLRDRVKHLDRPLRLLVPVWVDGRVTAASQHVYQTIYADIRRYSQELGVEDLLVFHEWVPRALMPAYYAAGAATLCIGNFVEAFGNAALESAACGTRPIVSGVAAHRSVLPDDVSTKVAPGDVDAIVDAVERAIRVPYPTAMVRELLAAENSYEGMLAEYERVITSARVTPPLREAYQCNIRDEQCVRLATWCEYFPGRGVYNDYLYEYVQDPLLVRLCSGSMLPATLSELRLSGIAEPDVARLITAGHLVRCGSCAEDNACS